MDNKKARLSDVIIIGFDLGVSSTSLREIRVFLNKLLAFSRVKGKILKRDVTIFCQEFKFPMSDFMLKIPDLFSFKICTYIKSLLVHLKLIHCYY